METKKVDALNIVLVIISLIIAIKLPFELFLFSYAVLGPLHYLTEIAWLREKDYFISADKKWSWIFIVLTVLMSVYPIIEFSNLGISQSLKSSFQLIGSQTNIFIAIGFLFAVSMLFFRKFIHLAPLLAVIIIISFVSTKYFPKAFLFVGVLLPTLVHVYVFTLLFILYGAIKSKSKFGIYLGLTLFAVPFIISYIPVDYLSYKPSEETISNFVKSNMTSLSAITAQLLGAVQSGGNFNALSETGLRIQAFIAFAYTYHYLNWFSKTSVIGWKDAISKKAALVILPLWMVSVGLYFYDYSTGLVALLLLSFLHVLLEFPLNAITIKEVILAVKKGRG